MKIQTLQVLLIITSLGLIQMASAQQIEMTIAPDHEMLIKGSSNVHDWQSNVTTVNFSALVLTGEDGHMTITKADVMIPVESIVSEKGKVMDKKTMKAFESELYPNIKFTLLKPVEIVTSAAKKAEAVGVLNIHNTKKEITFDLNIKRLEDQSLQCSASIPLLMTDFGIDPPTALLGTMKTRNEITIEFVVKLIAK